MSSGKFAFNMVNINICCPDFLKLAFSNIVMLPEIAKRISPEFWSVFYALTSFKTAPFLLFNSRLSGWFFHCICRFCSLHYDYWIYQIWKTIGGLPFTFRTYNTWLNLKTAFRVFLMKTSLSVKSIFNFRVRCY